MAEAARDLRTSPDAASSAFRFGVRAISSNNLCPAGQLRLSGPSDRRDAAHWPARGDLAHVALAGRCFVPYYAAPMPHRLTKPAALLGAPDGEALAQLAAGTGFAVLDISGGWCWGQLGDIGSDGGTSGGLVGYLPHAALATITP